VLNVQIEYFDGQFDDARYALALAQTAALHGASVLNHCEVVELLHDPENGRVIGAALRDNVSGQRLDVYARVVVNATGPFTDGIRKLAEGSDTPPIIRPSAGVTVET
jgi:glycerol-3-phosphate dehydrogenase